MEIKNHNFVNKILSAWVFAILAVGFLFFYFYQPAIAPERHDKIFCTMEAKLCPDGSAVGRTGPNCEFAECPKQGLGQEDVSAWQTYRNEKWGFEMKYPQDFMLWEQAELISFKLPNKGLEGPEISIIQLYTQGNSLEEIFFGFIDMKKDCKKISVDSRSAYSCHSGPNNNEFTLIIEYSSEKLFEIVDSIQSDISTQILSTFKFLK